MKLIYKIYIYMGSGPLKCKYRTKHTRRRRSAKKRRRGRRRITTKTRRDMAGGSGGATCTCGTPIPIIWSADEETFAPESGKLDSEEEEKRIDRLRVTALGRERAAWEERVEAAVRAKEDPDRLDSLKAELDKALDAEKAAASFAERGIRPAGDYTSLGAGRRGERHQWASVSRSERERRRAEERKKAGQKKKKKQQEEQGEGQDEEPQPEPEPNPWLLSQKEWNAKRQMEAAEMRREWAASYPEAAADRVAWEEFKEREKRERKDPQLRVEREQREQREREEQLERERAERERKRRDRDEAAIKRRDDRRKKWAEKPPAWAGGDEIKRLEAALSATFDDHGQRVAEGRSASPVLAAASPVEDPLSSPSTPQGGGSVSRTPVKQNGRLSRRRRFPRPELQPLRSKAAPRRSRLLRSRQMRAQGPPTKARTLRNRGRARG